MAIVNNTRKDGFTLIELVVSISIVVVLSIILVLTFSGYQNTNQLERMRDSVTNDFLDMQNYSVGGKLVHACVDNGSATADGICSSDSDCSIGSSPSCEPTLPAGGYGIFIDKSDCAVGSLCSYHLFADLNNDGKYASDNSERLSEGERIIENSENFYFDATSYRAYGASTFSNTTYPPLKIIFTLDGSININSNSIGDSNDSIGTQRIAIKGASGGDLVNIFVNRESGIVWGDFAEPSTSASPTGSPT